MKQPNNWTKIALLFSFAAVCFIISLILQFIKFVS